MRKWLTHSTYIVQKEHGEDKRNKKPFLHDDVVAITNRFYEVRIVQYIGTFVKVAWDKKLKAVLRKIIVRRFWIELTKKWNSFRTEFVEIEKSNSNDRSN